MEPHRIRLRGPWECEPLSRVDGGPLPSPLRMTLPCRWDEGGLANFAGRVRFTRRFGRPSNLDPTEQVWLSFAGVDTSASVTLNGAFLGTHEGADTPFAFEITPLLQPRNELQVDVECSRTSGGMWGEIALEIRRVQ